MKRYILALALLAGSLTAYIVILVVSTFAVMAVSGLVTQRVIDSEKSKEEAPYVLLWKI